jgi:hypothetical protein
MLAGSWTITRLSHRTMLSCQQMARGLSVLLTGLTDNQEHQVEKEHVSWLERFTGGR